MTNKNNFKWLETDIDNTLILRVVCNVNGINEFRGVFNILDVLETTGDELDIKTANIDDLTNMLTMGIVRFANVGDISDILDIPFRKLYLLYQNASNFNENIEGKLTSFNELDVFSVIDGEVNNDCLIYSALIDTVSDDLNKVMKIAYEFGNYGMQEKFDALSDITLINHRRLINDNK